MKFRTGFLDRKTGKEVGGFDLFFHAYKDLTRGPTEFTQKSFNVTWRGNRLTLGLTFHGKAHIYTPPYHRFQFPVFWIVWSLRNPFRGLGQSVAEEKNDRK